jgi:GAF domain-containing protein
MARNIEKHFVELSTLLETSRTVVASLDVTRVINSILEQVQRLLDIERCAIVVLDEQAGEFRLRASRGLSDQYVSQSLVLDDVLNNALDAVVYVMETDTGWVYLLAEGETILRLRVHRGLSARFVRQVAEKWASGWMVGWPRLANLC